MVNGVYATDVEYSFSVSNKNPYEKEAILVEVNLTQVEHEKVMLFKFSIKESEAYAFHQVGFKKSEKYHDLKEEYRYLLYPKKTGKVSIEFEMIKSITDDDKVAYSISGDRDNVKGLQKEDIAVGLEPLVIDVKALPKEVDLVGEFTLSYELDREKTEAYEPVNLRVKLEGRGYLKPFELLKKSSAYNLFTQAPTFKTQHTPKGSDSSLVWEYAISAKEHFVLEKVVLKAFNPKSKRLYELVLPSCTIEVEQLKESNLLDGVDTPPRAKEIDWSWFSWAFSYVVVFLAGWLMPRDLFKRKASTPEKGEDSFKKRVEEAKSHKVLLKLLTVQNETKFDKAITALEAVVYNGEKISLSKIKDMI